MANGKWTKAEQREFLNRNGSERLWAYTVCPICGGFVKEHLYAADEDSLLCRPKSEATNRISEIYERTQALIEQGNAADAERRMTVAEAARRSMIKADESRVPFKRRMRDAAQRIRGQVVESPKLTAREILEILDAFNAQPEEEPRLREQLAELSEAEGREVYRRRFELSRTFWRTLQRIEIKPGARASGQMRAKTKKQEQPKQSDVSTEPRRYFDD
jgi:hypothetical protein